MDAPCIHFFRESGDEITCLFCSKYPDEKRNGYVRREQAKSHCNWHFYAGPSPDRHRGNYFGKNHSPVKTLSDYALFNTPITELARLLGVTRSPIDKERRRRRNGVGSR